MRPKRGLNILHCPLHVCSLHAAVKLFARKAQLMGLPPPVSACAYTYIHTWMLLWSELGAAAICFTGCSHARVSTSVEGCHCLYIVPESCAVISICACTYVCGNVAEQ